MTTVEVKITDYYTVELTDEILEKFEEYEATAKPCYSYGQDLQSAALWALDNVYGYDSYVDHEVDFRVIIPDTYFTVVWHYLGNTIKSNVVVTETMRKAVLSNPAFRHDYEEYDDAAIAQWWTKNLFDPEVYNELDCYDIIQQH